MARKSTKTTAPVTKTVDADLNDFLAGLEGEAATLTAAGETAELEALVEAEAEAPAKVETAPVVEDVQLPEVEHVAGEMRELLDAVTQDQKLAKQAEVNDSFRRRLAYELGKNPDNTNIEKNLAGYQTKMSTLPLCGVLEALDVDPEFMNRSIAEGKRFNVYAIEKVNYVLMALETGRLDNAIANAVMRSLFAFRKAGVPFTGLMMAAAISDKVKVERNQHELLVRHTVSASTAPTQASQMGNALSLLGIVVNRGSAKYPVWQLTDTPQVRHLEEVLAA